MNLAPNRELEHGWLWDKHDFALATAICIWANYFVLPTGTRAQTKLGLGRDDCNILLALWLYTRLTASDVCFLIGRPRNSISRAVKRLLERGLIVGQEDAEDARKTILSMTSAGQEAINELIPIFVERQRVMLRRLNTRQQTTLQNLIATTLRDISNWSLTVGETASSLTGDQSS